LEQLRFKSSLAAVKSVVKQLVPQLVVDPGMVFTEIPVANPFALTGRVMPIVHSSDAVVLLSSQGFVAKTHVCSDKIYIVVSHGVSLPRLRES
jgi:hypothetical protein